MKSDRTLPYQIRPNPKLAVLFASSILIMLSMLYGYYHQPNHRRPHEKRMPSISLWFIYPLLVGSVAMLVDSLWTRTIFSTSEIQHISPMQSLRQTYGNLKTVGQSHKRSGTEHRFAFQDGSSFSLDLDRRTVDIDYVLALLLNNSPQADIELKLSHDLTDPVSGVVREASTPSRDKKTFFGFVAMEYHALILNRSFAIFVTPGALYGVKVAGYISIATPYYFERYVEMLKDESLAGDLAQIESLASLPGGFTLSRSRMRSVEFTTSRKWGMGNVPHSGRLFITSDSGARREFILVGDVDGQAIQQSILSIS